MSWNPYQCSYENVFDQNFWNCSSLLTQLKKLLAQAGERQSHTWTGIQSLKQHKSALFLTCLFYCWLYFMLKIGRKKKQRSLIAWFLFFLPPPFHMREYFALSPLPKLFHTIHSSHNHFWGSVFQPLQFWKCGYCRVSQFLSAWQSMAPTVLSRSRAIGTQNFKGT